MDITFRCVWVNKYPGVGLPDQTPIILKPARVSSAPTLARFGRKAQPVCSAAQTPWSSGPSRRRHSVYRAPHMAALPQKPLE